MPPIATIVLGEKTFHAPSAEEENDIIRPILEKCITPLENGGWTQPQARETLRLAHDIELTPKQIRYRVNMIKADKALRKVRGAASATAPQLWPEPNLEGDNVTDRIEWSEGEAQYHSREQERFWTDIPDPITGPQSHLTPDVESSVGPGHAIQNEEMSIDSGLSSTGPSSAEHSVNGSRHSLPESSITRTATYTHDPCVSFAPTIERARSILCGLLKKDGQALDPSAISTEELIRCTSFCSFMVCCGDSIEASCCIEYLLWCWHARAVSSLYQKKQDGPFVYVTRLLTWMMQTGHCDESDVVVFELWRRCHRAHGTHTFSEPLLLAVGQLALAVRAQGYDMFSQELYELWTLNSKDKMARVERGSRVTPRTRAALLYIQHQLLDHQSVSVARLPTGPESKTVRSGIRRLLEWILQQLHSYPQLIEREDITPEDRWKWCNTHHQEDARLVEQQLLLGYLVYQGTSAAVLKPLLLSEQDRLSLPWNVCLEWLLGEPPLVTLSVLSSMVRCANLPKDTMTSVTWCERMQDGVITLLADMDYTVLRFYRILKACCPESQSDFECLSAIGQRIVWESPVKREAPSDYDTTEDHLQILTERLVRVTALSGSVESATMAEQSNTTALDETRGLLPYRSPASSLFRSASVKSGSQVDSLSLSSSTRWSFTDRYNFLKRDSSVSSLFQSAIAYSRSQIDRLSLSINSRESLSHMSGLSGSSSVNRLRGFLITASSFSPMLKPQLSWSKRRPNSEVSFPSLTISEDPEDSEDRMDVDE